ncbi:MAG: thioredoxin-like domain-containing protein [Sphingobacterium hotanense]
MKNTLILFLFLVFFSNSYGQGFQLLGTVDGAKDGTPVKLMDQDTYPYQTLDSTITKDGKFQFKGTLNQPEKYLAVMIDPNPEIKEERGKEYKMYDFFATNTNMSINCSLADFPSMYGDPVSKYDNVQFSGSIAQEMYKFFKDMTSANAKKVDGLWKDYLNAYHRPAMYGIFNTEVGVELVKERAEEKRKLNEMTVRFLEKFNNSIVSVFIANNLINSNRSEFTAQQLDHLVGLFKENANNKVWVEELRRTADKQKVLAVGNAYHDIELTDSQKKAVKLSQFVKKGQYTFLEFWASWCSPCRAEIPHLKHLYEFVPKDKMSFVSISMDDNGQNWEKAMNEEKMPWVQLNDPMGFKGQVREAYQITGIPFSLIIDPEGKIVAGALRGAALDAKLIDLLGEEAFKGM